MEIFYIVIIVALFLLAISDLIVGVSNDAVNFLNSAVGSKATSTKVIFAVAALGIVIGCTFSSGMMEVARKGIFNPQHFYFSEIILLFLAVMVTDVLLLDAFNSFGMPTSTTVSIVFELLGAAVALSLIKIYTGSDGLELYDYINSDKALGIISGILMSVVIAFTAGAIVQYLSRLLFSFAPTSRLKYIGALWGGLAITAITYFMLVKGAKGASFMTADIMNWINGNTLLILGASFLFWVSVLQLVIIFTKVNILKIIVIVGTFSLAMAFAGNDLVNFIGVPLAGYNSYQIWVESGVGPDALLMSQLAGKVPTPTTLLLIAGIIMTITLWTSKKAKKVLQTSLDLGRQDEGAERFESYAVSRSLVRNASRVNKFIEKALPKKVRKGISRQFDETPFKKEQIALGEEAPVFDLLRAAVTLVVASVLIAIGTNLTLPLSTTYVTFMVFMGTSLADGAWGRESAVYRVSGVLSVIGGWFFTAFSAFSIAFIFANIFYFGGTVAIVIVLLIAGVIIYRSHRFHDQRLEEQLAFEKSLGDPTTNQDEIINRCTSYMEKIFNGLDETLTANIKGLEKEDLSLLKKNYKSFKKIEKRTEKIKNQTAETVQEMEGVETEAIHLQILITDYLNDMVKDVRDLLKPSLDHIDNNHKPLIPVQIEELRDLQHLLHLTMTDTKSVYTKRQPDLIPVSKEVIGEFLAKSMASRKNQIKRIKNQEIGTNNSLLYFNYLSGLRNIALTTSRMVNVFEGLILNQEDKSS